MTIARLQNATISAKVMRPPTNHSPYPIISFSFFINALISVKDLVEFADIALPKSVPSTSLMFAESTATIVNT